MPEPQQLTQLRDIYLPQPVSWWPPAPGWYFVALIAMLLITVIASYGYQYYANGRAKRQALLLLDAYNQQYLQDNNSQLISAKISELLRRVALVYFPREQVASLQGEAWLAFLNASGKNINFHAVRECLLELPYQSGQEMNLKPLFARARAWIKQRGVPCSN